jgi:NADH-ubiquinone oxidoreductase chain 5
VEFKGKMYILIIILPLISGIISGVFGRRCGRSGVMKISTSLIIITAILGWLGLFEVGIKGTPIKLTLGTWIETELMIVKWEFLFDSISTVMLVIITSISGLVHLYSSNYMSEDPHIQRFFSFLSLFTFFMIILVCSANYLVLFLGWEGVGILSFLLINFWFTRIQANKGALNALIVNRIGDFGLILALFMIYKEYGSLDFSIIFSSPIVDSDGWGNKEWIGIFLLIGVTGKSAQLLLHIWLPQSMEGPTPVSALLHAATMVTAGIFLIIRSSPLFEQVPIILNFMTILGALTAIFAASSGLLQNDIKKIIALSTCSQLGYLLMACGLSHYNIALYHLINHAWFKALLFLSAGSIIHGMRDEQDIRKMGGVKEVLPLTYTVMTIGSTSLMGLPFLTGFWSKEAILEIAAAKGTNIGIFVTIITIIAAGITAVYTIRSLILIYIIRTNTNSSVANPSRKTRKSEKWEIKEGEITMIIPLIILTINSIGIGYIMKDIFIGLGSNFFVDSTYINPLNLNQIEAEYQTILKKLTPLIIIIISGITIIGIYRLNPKILIKMKKGLGRAIYIFLNQRYLFETIYNKIILKNILKIGYNHTFKIIDRGLLENIGPEGLKRKFLLFANRLNVLHTGFLQHYTLYFIIGIIIIVGSPIICSIIPIKLYLLIVCTILTQPIN